MADSKRRHPRVKTNLQVSVRSADGNSATAQKISNISLGGVFLEMEDPWGFGTEMTLEFRLPAAPSVIKCRGFVVWSTKTSPERGEGHQGCGVRLMDIDISSMRVLANYIEKELVP